MTAVPRPDRAVTPAFKEAATASPKKRTALSPLTLRLTSEERERLEELAAGMTVENYSRTGYIYLRSWAKKPINEITRQMVLKKHQEMSRKNGKVTANDSFRHFRSVYNFIAATEDDFAPDPVSILSQARAWNKERRRQTVIAAKQLPAWWAASLRWENIDLDERKLRLPTTKNGDPLMLPLSDYLFNLLRERKDSAGASPWVFPGNGPAGHIVEPKKFSQRVAAASGVTFTLHDLRRTYITIAESLDIPHYALKRLLNHRSSADVTGGYIIINVDRLRGPVELISERILEMKEAND